MRARCAVVVFARVPLPGRVKTRLAPLLGAWGAARLHARLARRAVRTATRSACGEVELHGTPNARHTLLRVAAPGVARLYAQRGNDLGERMLNAIASARLRSRAVLLIGTDCPSLNEAHLRRSARALAGGCDAVLIPAEDGGYALIGLRRLAARVFEDIAWGGDDVCERTCDRLRELGWRWRVLAPVWDVDRAEDLDRLRAAPIWI